MKRVSFKVAKAIKKAGYPPLKADWSYDARTGEHVHFVDDADYVVSAPYAMDVWLWLWREKKIDVTPYNCPNGDWVSFDITSTDPEEAIIAAIEYLVEHNLIK